MGLLSFYSRKDSAAAPAGEAVQHARTRARRRLIGAAVLVGVGIIGFPLLFETQPRPIAVDVPIEIPRKDAVAPLVLPPQAARAAASAVGKRDEVITEAKADSGRVVAAPSEPAPNPAPPAVAAKPAPSSAPAKPEKLAKPDKAESPAKPEKAAVTTETGRVVVQVGAYADANAARDARQRIEKLGLKSFTQVVETDAGKRIRVRVGPFASRDEADKAAGRLKSAGLPAAVMSL